MLISRQLDPTLQLLLLPLSCQMRACGGGAHRVAEFCDWAFFRICAFLALWVLMCTFLDFFFFIYLFFFCKKKKKKCFQGIYIYIFIFLSAGGGFLLLHGMFDLHPYFRVFPVFSFLFILFFSFFLSFFLSVFLYFYLSLRNEANNFVLPPSSGLELIA